jgi:Asp-tRNA(Asn)/Glu-tRNA(Gln) amidotransferase A subunit family amidase
MKDIVFSTTTQLAAAIRAGHISASEVLEAHLEMFLCCWPIFNPLIPSYWMISAHGAVFNYTGHPAIVLPYTLDRDDLPIGIQMVGKRWDESRLLGMAKALSEVTGAFRRPPGY